MRGFFLQFASREAAESACPALFDAPDPDTGVKPLAPGALDRSGGVWATAPVPPVTGEAIDPQTGEPEIVDPGTPGTPAEGYVVLVSEDHPALAEALDYVMDPAPAGEAGLA